MRKLFIVSVALVLSTAAAEADLTFAQWSDGPSDKRAIYTAGVMEAVGVYAESLGFASRWSACLERLRLSYGEIGEGTLAFAKLHPELNKEPAPAVIIAYMNQRCGFTAPSQ